MFYEGREKMKNRITLKKKSDPWKFAIPLCKLVRFLKTLEYWPREKFWDLVSGCLILCLEMLETSVLGLGQDLGLITALGGAMTTSTYVSCIIFDLFPSRFKVRDMFSAYVTCMILPFLSLREEYVFEKMLVCMTVWSSKKVPLSRKLEMCSSFTFPNPTTTADDLEDLYKVYGVDRSIVLDFAGTHETPETILELILEVLAELGLSLAQLLPNFLRHLVAFLVKAREEGLAFGLSEFRQFVLVKRNNQNPGTFLVSPRPGRHVIEDIPYRDEKWREQIFVFKMDQASIGDFDFSQLSRRWAENIVPSGSFSMSDEIFGLMRVLRRGRSNWFTFNRTRIKTIFALPVGIDRAPLVEESEDEAEHSQEVVATPSVQTQSSDRLTRQLVRRSLFRTSGSASRGRASGKSSLISIHDLDNEDVSGETVAETHKRRRSSEGALPGSSRRCRWRMIYLRGGSKLELQLVPGSSSG
ncbi:hypothetical protein DY000_02052341 [Brassica cretica]|uniref:Uncharacterized protein n=1 Tax=Brassica cretica TaxID=69181 RepID=A0ABQ7A450_BRACR|nr:hypothetical protein DY000_02052341 [Brassica cretica]